MTKRKAEHALEKRTQHALDEHEMDLYLNTTELDAAVLEAADVEAKRSCEEDKPVERTDEVHGEQPAPAPTPELLPGMVLLKGFLLPSEQQELVDASRTMGLQEGGFYKPTYASGAKCRLHQMCLGRHWNVVTEQYEQVRTNHDNAPVIPLPERWKELCKRSLAAAVAVDPRVMGSCKRMEPDVCVVNYYKKAGRNGMHIDKDESEEAMEWGSPVVSFSIGSKADFAFAPHYPERGEGVPIVALESGDVLLFGGPSRKVVHALTRVYPNTQSEWLRMRSGRLNLTFREYKPTE
ncbi:TPA: hypothetical protein N0F65_007730 [Lagenidium giganteum]|uniref:Fe2OG dioxygenase domain-containing protein n=1 Tax=Lagenidium giganteum TaxID=4803 RepID=A0AAV2Z2W7_9STRA|nr:TPA: hypothetical protein N0F65_007730 [Lagenidium giganteum]